MPANPLKSVYRRLRQVGLTKPYVTKVALPAWWNDALAENPAGFAQCLILLSRHLGLDLRTLQASDSPLRLRDFGICKYKKRQGTTEDELLLSRVIATRAAQLAGAALERPYQPLPANPSDVRQAIIERAAWVGFEDLLDYCWSLGIPVLHINYFPTGAKRPDGFTLRLEGRPVVVLCRAEKQPSWLLFILAHELGHIGCGHIPEGGALLDERLRENEPDQEEDEADRYAMELLSGAVSQLDPGANAIETVCTKLAANLDWERLPQDSRDFLMRITRQSQEADEAVS